MTACLKLRNKGKNKTNIDVENTKPVNGRVIILDKVQTDRVARNGATIVIHGEIKKTEPITKRLSRV